MGGGRTSARAALSAPLARLAPPHPSHLRLTSRLCLRGTHAAERSEGELERPDANAIAVRELDGGRDPLPAHRRAVLAAKVFQRCPIVCNDKPGVMARYGW